VAAEIHIVGILINGLLHIEWLEGTIAARGCSIKFTWHNIIFPIYGSQTSCGPNQNKPVHPVGNMHSQRCRTRMIHVEPGIQYLKREHFFMTGSHEGSFGTTSETIHCVKVDVVG